MSTLPTLESITSLYLYGSETPPDNLASDSIIRPPLKEEELEKINVDLKEFMEGPGRFVTPGDFSFIKYFFNPDYDEITDSDLDPYYYISGKIEPGRYTKKQIFDIFNITSLKEKIESQIAGLYDDGKDDLIERAYIWNTMAFQINDDAVFVVNKDGTRAIENFAIIPYRNGTKPHDNFDFEGGFFSNLVNSYLKSQIDPSGIGRKVNIFIDGDVNKKRLDQNEYNRLESQKNGWRMFNGAIMALMTPKIVDRLWERGIIRSLRGNKPIIYGTKNNDEISAYVTTEKTDISKSVLYAATGVWYKHILSDFTKYGITYIGGDGDDTIEGTEHSDILKGNSDNDTLSGKGGDDQLEGGSGSDTYYIEGHDTVFDADSMGKLFFGKDKAEYFIPETPNSDDSWISSDSNGEPDGKFRAVRDGKNLVVTSAANEADKVTVKDYFNGRDTLDGALDLHDVAPKPGEATEYTITPKRYDVHNEYNLGPDSYLVQGSLENDLIWANSALSGKSGYGLITQTGAGNDIVYGSLYPDIIEGGADTDVLFGSAPKTAFSWKRKVLDANLMSGNEGRDFIMGGFGNDIIHAGNINEHLQLQERKGQGDWVNGAEGDDSLYGSAAQDIVQGGAGADTIRGGAGNDLLVGDSNAMVYAHIDRSHGAYLPITHIHSYNLKEKRWNHIEEVQISNRLIDKSVAWKLEIDHDKQDYFITRDYHDWKNNASLVAEEEGAGDDIEGGTGDDMLIGQRGDDILNGQGGDDIVFGDDNRDKSIVGNDHLRGGSGSDTLIGGKGADSYYFFREELKPEEGKPAPTDIVIDDGLGDNNYQKDEIFLDGFSISSLKWNYDKERKIWSDDENGWQITKKGSELNITHKDYPGVIRVLDYAYGDYELRLSENKNGPFPDPEPAKPVPPQPEPPKPEQPKPEPKQPQAPTAGKPLAAQSIHEKDKLSYTLAEDAFHTANKDDKLTWSARLADGKPLPKWLNFDAATRTFSGTPGNDDVGVLDIEISVQGKGGAASQHLALNVINVNDAPYISAPFSLHSTNSGGEIKCNSRTYIRDIDKGDKLTFSAEMRDGQPLPSWLSIDSETGVLTGTLPFARETKDYYVRITATDKAGASTSGVLLIRGEFRRGRRNGTDNDDILKGGLPRMNMIIHGYGGNDTITGSNLHDDLYGDKGNDVLDGGSGNDIYHFARGDGNDIINNHDTGARRHDSIDFSDMNRSDFDIRREGNNLVLRSKDGNNQITVTNHFQPGWQIDGIRFADGMTLDHNAINSLTGAQNPPQGNYTDPATQALQMNQAIASLNSQAQPLDALATPDLQPRPLLAAGNP